MPPHHHPNPAFRTEHDQWLWLNRLPWHQLKGDALDERGEDELHHGSVIATRAVVITNNVEDTSMQWERMTRGRLVCNLGAYRGMVERTENDRTWSACVHAPNQVYQSVFDYPSMTEAQAWVERKIETLLSTPRSSSSG